MTRQINFNAGLPPLVLASGFKHTLLPFGQYTVVVQGMTRGEHVALFSVLSRIARWLFAPIRTIRDKTEKQRVAPYDCGMGKAIKIGVFAQAAL